jgi:hypothetical protein
VAASSLRRFPATACSLPLSAGPLRRLAAMSAGEWEEVSEALQFSFLPGKSTLPGSAVWSITHRPFVFRESLFVQISSQFGRNRIL